MDLIQRLDPAKLVLAGTALSFVISPFSSPTYNLPIFLFGTYIQDNTDAHQSLGIFTGLLSGSILFDIIWMIKDKEANGFIKFLLVLLLLLKIPTSFVFGLAVRQRGGHLNGLGIRDGDLSGPPVWSMPARDGYQSLDEPSISTPKGPGPTVKPAIKHSAPGAPDPAPIAYQTV